MNLRYFWQFFPMDICLGKNELQIKKVYAAMVKGKVRMSAVNSLTEWEI